MKYTLVIGLEVHLQVKTQSKMFCACSADYFNQTPNTRVCPVCLGLPGALPVPNKVAIQKALLLAMGLNCSINAVSKFDRKNYFYPDLAKGYQITQSDQPFGYDGYLEIEQGSDSQRIRIARVHLEEDTAKSLHQESETLIDFNKSGIALIEIVTQPDFTDEIEVEKFAKRLHQVVRYLDISDASMEKGQMRFELNMSLRPQGSTQMPNYKVEVKNIGSISVLQKVIASEYARQSALLDAGQTPAQETRGLIDMTGATKSQRTKENSEDYRYFPEPDIPPMSFAPAELDAIRAKLVALPAERKMAYVQKGIEVQLADAIVMSRQKSDWFDQMLAHLSSPDLAHSAAKWYVGDFYALKKEHKHSFAQLKMTPEQLAELVNLVAGSTISMSIAKQILPKCYTAGTSPRQIVESEGLAVISAGDELKSIVDAVIAQNPKVVEDSAKNPNAAKFLIGCIMRETKGRADHAAVTKLIDDALSQL